MTCSSAPIPELRCDSKPFTSVVDCARGGQGNGSKHTAKQHASSGNSLLGEFCSTIIEDQGASTPTSNGPSPCIKAPSGSVRDEFVAEVPALQDEDDDDDEVWIPKGPPSRPSGSQTKPVQPKPKPK